MSAECAPPVPENGLLRALLHPCHPPSPRHHRGLECARRQAARRRRAHPQQQVQPPQEPPQAKAQRLGRLCRRADAAGGARHRAGGRPARGHHRRFHTPLARPAAATCLGQLHLGPAPTAALWKLLLRVVPPLGPAPPRRQRASFPLHALGASDARPDPVTVAVKAVTGQRVNDMVTTRSKAKHEAPQGAAAPQARLCRTRSHHAPRAASRDVPSVSVHRAIARRQQFEHDYLRHCSVSFFTPSRGAGAPDCTERTPHRPLPGPSMPQAPVRPPGERRRSLRLRDQVHDTPGVHKS